MNPRRLVAVNLIRIYRPIAMWFWATMAVCVAIGMTAVILNVNPSFSLWLVMAGSAAKWWLGVIGVLLVSMHLRQFVGNGITRRDFLAGAAIFGLLAVVLFSVAVPLGHGVEQLLLSLGGPLPSRYPTTSFGTGLRELGYELPGSVAFLVTGVAGTAGFYRFGVPGGLALLPVAALPVAAVESLLGIDERGGFEVRFVPYAVALLISLLAITAGALLYQRELRDVAIPGGAA
jgi:hypothetical protein